MALSEIASAAREAVEPEELDFNRTIDRRMVHRASVAEVFVTGMQRTGSLSFRSAAQLPVSHSYYNDHTEIPARFDPLLLLETCRQASIHGAHELLEIPLETTFMVNDWDIHLDGGDALTMGERPGELLLSQLITPTHDRRERVTALGFDIQMEIAGVSVGGAHIRVSSAPTPQYASLRFMQRGSAPPMTSAFRGTGDRRTSVQPSRINRFNPANVVLTDTETDAEKRNLSAVLAPDFRNAGLFDHDYDHIPAMVLMEAARQSALLLQPESRSTGKVHRSLSITSLEASFSRFAELDSPIRVVAAAGFPSSSPQQVSVTLEQSGESVAVVSVTVRPPVLPANS
ncbi:hypothetical protein CP967_30545 [Streptomyces nitrosporeus]|uniref:A-factor biosynthesis hotdog domain-containing protein n=1 Tax=Streptomyces nitrosporeus TaxID=28894 RepID=A0A5J6FHQ6_9ACTN|nr:ScbA/BarX family gamma-butyrolactone biosynthesis protein [Streptomyces nitrosporeus]QEU75743.1 hypothetical protein CP967_30545 [Streptomyces nitrosporeus]GGY87692.1 hypothetical protein GCM10010327_17950 [Streptomyces nitrosporeus]